MIGKVAKKSMLAIATACMSGMVVAEPEVAPTHVEEMVRPEPASNAIKYRGMSIRAPVVKDVPDYAEELEQEQAGKASQRVDATLEPRAPEDTMK